MRAQYRAGSKLTIKIVKELQNPLKNRLTIKIVVATRM